MKKLLFLLVLTFSVGIAVKAQDDKDKVKKTSSPTQKAHNVVSKHNKYNGYKVKHVHNGTKHKKLVKGDKVETKTN